MRLTVTYQPGKYDMKTFVNQKIKEAVDAGFETARAITSIAQRDDDYTISIVGEGDRKAHIVEFGAGNDTATDHEFAPHADYPIKPGSYSETVGTHEYANTGRWHWHKTVFTGIAPRRPLLHAMETIRRELHK